MSKRVLLALLSKKNQWSLDQIALGSVATACACTLFLAYAEGSEPLWGQTNARDYRSVNESSINFTDQHCRFLEQNGYVVIDNFLTPEQIRTAVASLAAAAVQEGDYFQPSPNEQNGDTVRTDRVFFFRQKDVEKEVRNGGGALSRVRDLFYGLGYDIATSDFQGFDEDFIPLDDSEDDTGNSASFSWLGVPDQMQVSLYSKMQSDDESNGDGDSSRKGDFYEAHTDACDDSLADLGLIGYLKARYLRRRYLTCIVYLNPDWETSHGGCLRIYHKEQGTIDIEPRAGRLVIFSSVHIRHAVLPTFSRRFACSMWMTLNHG